MKVTVSRRVAIVKKREEVAKDSFAQSTLPMVLIIALINIFGAILLALILVNPEDQPIPMIFLRLLIGLPYVLFTPGFILQTVLFPRGVDLDIFERSALSFGLSFAIVTLDVLILDSLSWDLRPIPIVLSLIILHLAFSTLSIFQRWMTPAESRFPIKLKTNLHSWWLRQPRWNRILFGIVGLALITATFSTMGLAILPHPGEEFTEFYLLGKQGLVEGFPRWIAKSELQTVTLGLANNEKIDHTYRVEAWAMDPLEEGRRAKVAESIPIPLPKGERIEWPVAWRMPWAGEDQVVEFQLFIDDEPTPYRQLRLFLNVTE